MRVLRTTVGILLLLLVLLAGLIWAVDRPLDVSAYAATGPIPQALPKANPPAGLRFSVIETAKTSPTPEAVVVAGGSWLETRQPIQMAVLVDHPQGRLLFDTGLGREIEQQFQVNSDLHQALLDFGEVDPAIDQLMRHSHNSDYIDLIVPSHMHWDHISGLEDFPGVPVWVRPAERALARSDEPPRFLQSQFDDVEQWRDLELDDGAYLGFDRSLDVFADGAVVLVPLPGHSAGQVGMFLNLPSGERYFFSADVTWTIEGLRRPADRSWLTRKLIGVDADVDANQHTIVQIHRLMKAHPELKVVPAHDEHVAAGLPRYPEFRP